MADVGDVVCLEVFDDVGVEKLDGTKVAEQIKSTLGYNPLADREVAFWKTIANWLDAIESKMLDVGTTRFEIYVSRAVVPGVICDSFNKAADVAMGEKAAAAARCELWGAGPKFEKKGSVAASLAPQVNRALRHSDSAIGALASRMKVVLGNGNPFDEVRVLLTNKLVSSDAYEDVVKWVLGWVKKQTDEMIQRAEPARISYDVFHAALLGYVRRHDRETTLRSIAGDPDPELVAHERGVRTYVDQLEIVDADEEDVLAAINDFLRAATDRTSWAERGFIDGKALDAFEEELMQTWRNHKRKLDITARKASPQDRGLLVFSECNGHTAKPGGLDCPPHFTRGSFHALADDEAIGWHPDYAAELTRTRALRQTENAAGVEGEHGSEP